MAAPTRGEVDPLPAETFATRSLNSIVVEWAAMTGDDARGAAVDSYRLDSDGGVPTAALEVIPAGASFVLTHTVNPAAPGSVHRFQVSAHNVHGWSPASAIVSFQAAAAPGAPLAATTALVDKSVRITWQAPETNYKPIDSYEIQVLNLAGTAYATELANCNGASAAIRNSVPLHCDIPVSLLLVSPFNLQRASPVVARVRAHNERGDGPWSPDNASGANIQTVPAKMASPARGSGTGPDRVELTWSSVASPADGDSAVTSYALEWDEGAGAAAPFKLLAGEVNYQLASYLVTSAVITAGAPYRFRIHATNFWGPGEDSNVVEIVAASKPGQPAAPSTAVEATAGAVVITWVAPDARGATITSYAVEIQGSTGWSAEPGCGAGPAVTCTVAMSRLRTPVNLGGFGLTQGASVLVAVAATNYWGTGTTSSASADGAHVRDIPGQMPKPRRGTGTSETQITVQWDPVAAPADGDSEITAYDLTWSTGTGSWTALATLQAPFAVTEYIVGTGLTSGGTYNFKIRASNIYGAGPDSDAEVIVASDRPAQMLVATTSIVGTAARINWTPPASHGQQITAYEVLIADKDGALHAETDACDGSSAAIVNDPSCCHCDIPLTTLRGPNPTTFSLPLGRLIQVRIRAENAQGFGPQS